MEKKGEYPSWWNGKVGADLIFTNSESLFPDEGNRFRPIYYLGCKASFVSSIRAAINEVAPKGGRLVDLFAGTGAVAAAMGSERNVTTVDIQEYSRVLCSALLKPANISPAFIRSISSELISGEITKRLTWCVQPLINYEVDSMQAARTGAVENLLELLESPPLVYYAETGSVFPDSLFGASVEEVARRLAAEGLVGSPDTTVCRNFGGIYFSFQQAVFLDAALSLAENMEEGFRDTLKAAALSCASALVNTVGKQFAQPIQPRNRAGVIKHGLANAVHRDRSLDAANTHAMWLGKYANLPCLGGNPIALRLDYLEALEQRGHEFSVVYADPPYTRDHYSRFYHVLETMCLRDSPPISKTKRNGCTTISRGVYREDRHQSPFCIRSAAPGAFDSLFKASRNHNLPLVLSYSPHETGDGTHPRAVSMDQIIALANQYYSRVEVCGVSGVKHNKLNRNGLELKTREQAEVIIKCFI